VSAHTDIIREALWDACGPSDLLEVFPEAASALGDIEEEILRLRDAGQRLHDLRDQAESCRDPAEAPLKGEWDEAWFALGMALAAGTPSEDT
jgi:hypothetical protein